MLQKDLYLASQIKINKNEKQLFNQYSINSCTPGV